MSKIENKLSRRFFLKSASLSVAAGTVVAQPLTMTTELKGDSCLNAGKFEYPTKSLVINLSSMQVNVPIAFNYPDPDSPCVAIKMEKSIPGGAGPEKNVVAFSILCSHMGCPVTFDAIAKTFKCPCHYSIFDPENHGQMVCGQATTDLPQIQLQYDANTDLLSANGIRGLIYGRVSNIL